MVRALPNLVMVSLVSYPDIDSVLLDRLPQ